MQAGVVEIILGILSVVLAGLCAGLIRRLSINKARQATERLEHEKKLAAAQGRLTDILENSADVASFADRQERLLYVNQAGRKMLGWGADEDISRLTLANLYPASLADQVLRKAINSALENGTWKGETMLERRGGTPIPVSQVIVAHRQPDGRLDSFSAIMRDITPLKTVERALRESEERFRQIIETSPMGVHLYQLEPDGRLILIGANPAADRILGIEHSKLVGKTLEEAFPPLSGTDVPRRYRQVAAEGRPWSSQQVDYQHDKIAGAYEVCAFQTKPNSLAVMFLDITQRKRTEVALRESEVRLHRLASAIEQAAEDITITDIKGNIEYVNPAFEHITGYTWAEVVGRNSRLLKSGKQTQRFYQELWSTITSGKTWTGRFINRCKDGALVDEEATISPIFAPQGDILGFVSLKRDITEQVKMEQHLRQAQKMEAIGQLAGGVAHDFNNLLQAIKGFTDLALEELQTDHAAREHLGEVIKASNRATVLVRQLLAFSRRESIRPQPLHLNDLLGSLVKMISRVIGEHIELNLIPRHNLNAIYADPGQMEQILMNLCVNARDAMPQGGRITIETANVSFDDNDCVSKPWARPGSFVGLYVADTGVGMSPEVLEHLFEPFFTTKEVGKGTGLGLATIYGIVKQHEGLIQAESELRRGSVFRIYLPALEEAAEAETAAPALPPQKSQGETILLAEDESVVRELALRILEKAGYHVLVAHDGDQAIALFHQHADRIDLALLDVVMPHKSGRAVCEEIRAVKPKLAVLFTSGYGRAHLGADFEPQEGTELMHKPFEPSELLAKVREILKR